MARLGRRRPFRPILLRVKTGVLTPGAGTGSFALSASGTAIRKRAGSGTGSFAPSASGTAVRRLPRAGTTGVVFAASGTAAGRRRRSGATGLVFTASALSSRGFPAAGPGTLLLIPAGSARRKRPVAGSCTLLLIAAGRIVKGVPASGGCRVVFRARGRLKVPAVVFGESYLGRFQAGSSVPLAVLVRDGKGRPAVPTGAAPVASVYALDAGAPAHPLALAVPALRGSRSPSVFAGPLRLGPGLPAGRYAVVFRFAVGAFAGFETATFEVGPGGDAAGPVVAGASVTIPGDDRALVQLGSGALVAGRKPR